MSDKIQSSSSIFWLLTNYKIVFVDLTSRAWYETAEIKTYFSSLALLLIKTCWLFRYGFSSGPGKKGIWLKSRTRKSIGGECTTTKKSRWAVGTSASTKYCWDAADRGKQKSNYSAACLSFVLFILHLTNNILMEANWIVFSKKS